MKKTLKLKILAGFMLLVALLTVAGTISIIEFMKLSNTVNTILEDNYKTIEASKSLLEALERKDSGVLLFLLGEKDEGIEIIKSADDIFYRAFEIASSNITEKDEDILIEKISGNYEIYKNKINILLKYSNIPLDITYYHNEIYLSFQEVKSLVSSLMTLNQDSLYKEAYILKEKSHRAVMPGIVAIIGALIFSLILSFFISRYFISPLSEIADAIKKYDPKDKKLNINIKSDDEIKRIEEEVNNLITKLEVGQKIFK